LSAREAMMEGDIEQAARAAFEGLMKNPMPA
jgi:hypothetical protein